MERAAGGSRAGRVFRARIFRRPAAPRPTSSPAARSTLRPDTGRACGTESALIWRFPAPRSEPPRAPVHAGGRSRSSSGATDSTRSMNGGELRGPISAGCRRKSADNQRRRAGRRARRRSRSATRSSGRAPRAALSEMVSEMRLDGDGEASLFLDRSRTEIVARPRPRPAGDSIAPAGCCGAGAGARP